ncbi:MAG: tRNA preQ1(34) S-adenosylmethionine ribosyltransferase-isomerase QueA [Myxococcales bacterium]|nr:tRNA preQ1(34) S-adenosylmethionine ribosyltransferase-isomerase QueA [Myxococcales bacterium]MCB9531109.1 tRNA preQ1(34) S-adenosylmethionine ribosyltransferase-isomerase QueA [Myxococcales bacterium]MCB9533019.1 tRNA preQ1(34) S-adenosylmethionine ribosyltransferase-isomerase QueA [Myxococcales bacterium]
MRAYDFALPEALIASTPAPRRRDARMLVLSEPLGDATVADFVDQLDPRDLVVLNDARVSRARIWAKRATGGRVEIFVVGFDAEGDWRGVGRVAVALVRSNRGVAPGEVVAVDGGGRLRIEAREGAAWRVSLVDGAEDFPALMEQSGALPLPPYIVRERERVGMRVADAVDAERYQTVYAAEPGAVAAPTAGLHLDAEHFAALEARGIETARVTLWVGTGTFKPVTADRLSAHEMHAERIRVGTDVSDAVERARRRGGRVVAIGTTVARVLESSADALGRLSAGESTTRLCIAPGYRWRVVDALLTNFHLPRSTLLALVSSFAGYARVRAGYAHAIAHRYRFYSYGDAMWIPRRDD